MTKNETAQLLAYLCSAFPQVVIRKENAEMYHRFLEDLTFSDALQAADVLIMESKWFPSVAQIREGVGTVSGEIGPATASAWLEVLKCVREVGHYGRPEFGHPAIKEAVEKIGWRNLCMGDSDSIRIQFSQVYQRRTKPLPQLGQQKQLVSGNEDF